MGRWELLFDVSMNPLIARASRGAEDAIYGERRFSSKT
jgi:hypothetical protein